MHEVSCDSCGLDAYAATANLLQTNSVGFDTLLEEPELPSHLRCPSCGRELQVTRTNVGYWPDEPELPALFWRAAVDEEEIGDPEWFLLSAPQPVPESLAEIGEALLDEKRYTRFEEISEEELLEQWGRPLSLRSAWQFLFSGVSGGGFAKITPVEGMTLLAFEVPDEIGDEAELKAWISEQMSKLPMPKEGDGGYAFRLSEGALEAGGFTEWGGPWVDKIGRREIIAFAFIERGPLLERLQQAIVRAGVKEAEPLRDLMETTEQDEKADEAEAGEQTAQEEAVWLSDEGVRFPIYPGQLAFYATVRGVTLAEAANQCVSAQVMLARTCKQAASNVQRALDRRWKGKATITLLTPERADLSAGGKMVGIANLSSLLEKFDYDTDDPVMVERIVTMVETMENAESGEPISTCNCGQYVYLRHLRPLNFESRSEPRFCEQIEDAIGLTFSMLPAVDCPHSVCYLTSELVSKLEQEGETIEHRLDRGQELAQFNFSVGLLRDALGVPVGAILRGHNIGTVLAYPSLFARLLVHLGKKVPFQEGEHVWAFAVTTDVAVVAHRNETAIERANSALSELKMRNRGLAGSLLGFTAHPLPRKVKPRGLINLQWDREPSRVA